MKRESHKIFLLSVFLSLVLCNELLCHLLQRSTLLFPLLIWLLKVDHKILVREGQRKIPTFLLSNVLFNSETSYFCLCLFPFSSQSFSLAASSNTSLPLYLVFPSIIWLIICKQPFSLHFSNISVI